jgi:hypothetical protein
VMPSSRKASAARMSMHKRWEQYSKSGGVGLQGQLAYL